MRVLLYTSVFAFQGGNGGRTVFLKTKATLERAGIQVELFDQWGGGFEGYDLVHCFTMETTTMWDFVKSINRRLAVSPISWYGVYVTRRSRIIRWFKRRVQAKIKCPFHPWWEDYFEFPDIFFPQSRRQAEQLAVGFGVRPERTLVVYHGVDEKFVEASPVPFKDRYRREDFVLCVGRFEPRKNQLGLIRALRGTGLPLVFIGQPDNGRLMPYYQQCVQEAGDSALFIWEIDHDSELLRSAYAAARVTVLPSHLEFPGLAVLEAGLAGCEVAVTERGCADEYLGPHASYFDPYSEASIRRAVLERYRRSSRPNTELQEHLHRNFLWDTVIKRQIEGYQRLLDEDTHS